jgi:ABC-2 type transport system ATP-binding protein
LHFFSTFIKYHPRILNIMLKVSNLKKNYEKLEALKGISFEAQAGKVLALLGPNGAGKTTTMRIITGFLAKSSGTVEIDNLSLENHLSEIQNKIGYLPENAPLYSDLSVHETLNFMAQIHGITGSAKEQAIQSVIAETGLQNYLHHNISELSKGYKQRVGLAQALIHDPSILILDEPTTGLDPNQILEIRNLIKRLGKSKTIILSTHIMQEVEAICDEVILINHGEIIASGTPQSLMQGREAKHQIRVVIEGSMNSAKKALEQLAKIEKILHEDNAPQGTCILLVESTTDLRSEINKALIQAELDVLEISASEQSMEKVFYELTK